MRLGPIHFISRGRVTTLADLYGYHGTPRRDLEFTGIQIGRFKMLGVLHARTRTGEAQPRVPAELDFASTASAVEYDAPPSLPQAVRR